MVSGLGGSLHYFLGIFDATFNVPSGDGALKYENYMKTVRCTCTLLLPSFLFPLLLPPFVSPFLLILSDAMIAAKDNDSYVLPDKREETLDVLHSLDSIGLISVLKSEDKGVGYCE